MYSLWQDLSLCTVIFDLVILTSKFDLLLKNFNFAHNVQTRTDRAFILHMCASCDKHTVPNFFTLWPDLEDRPIYCSYFCKTLTFAITFKPEEIGLHNCTCIFLVTRLFTEYHNIWFWDLDLEFDPHLKNFDLGCYLVIVAARRASLSSGNFYIVRLCTGKVFRLREE